MLNLCLIITLFLSFLKPSHPSLQVMTALRSSDSSPDAPEESGLMQDGGDGVQDAAIEAGDNDGADLLERAAAMEEEEV